MKVSELEKAIPEVSNESETNEIAPKIKDDLSNDLLEDITELDDTNILYYVMGYCAKTIQKKISCEGATFLDYSEY
jgi:uncharacterized protein YbgA (DUF1722 family)